MISQNHSETPRLNVGNPLFWKKRGQPTFIERHSANLQKAQEQKENIKKVNRSYEFHQNSQSSYFIPQDYDPTDKYENTYLPKCLRDQKFSQTSNIRSQQNDQILQQTNKFNNEALPIIHNQYKHENKQNISLLGLDPEQRKKLLSLDLSKLNTSNNERSRYLNDSNTTSQNVYEQLSYNYNNSMDICESPNINSNQLPHQDDSSSTRVRESLFMLPRPHEITRDQRKMLLDDLESAYFKFKKDQQKHRFFSSNNRHKESKQVEYYRNARKSNNGIRLDPLNNQSMDLPSVINQIEASDLMEDRTLDSNRIEQILRSQDKKLKNRRKLSNEIKEENGIKYPLRLHMMNNYRKNKIDEIIKNKGYIDTNLRHPADENYMETIWKNMPEYQKVVDDERHKRTREINSRKAQHTPIYDVLSLNNQQKKRVEKLFQGVIPLESRFYAVVQNKDEIHYKKNDSLERYKQQQSQQAAKIS